MFTVVCEYGSLAAILNYDYQMLYTIAQFQDKVGEEVLASECDNTEMQNWVFDKSNV